MASAGLRQGNGLIRFAVSYSSVITHGYAIVD